MPERLRTLSIASAATLIVVGLMWRPSTEGSGAGDATPLALAPEGHTRWEQLLDQQRELNRRVAELALRLDAFEARRPRVVAGGTNVDERGAQETASARALATRPDAPAPPAFQAWFDDALAAREQAEREEIETQRQEVVSSLLEEEMMKLNEELELSPAQSSDVFRILSDQAHELTTLVAGARSPLDVLPKLKGLRESRNSQMEQVLDPDQYAEFLERPTPGPPPGLPLFGRTAGDDR